MIPLLLLESETKMSGPVQVIVVTDEETGYESLYIDGQLRMFDVTIYASDIASQVTGETIQFSHVSLRLPEQQEWPATWDECARFRTVELAEG